VLLAERTSRQQHYRGESEYGGQACSTHKKNGNQCPERAGDARSSSKPGHPSRRAAGKGTAYTRYKPGHSKHREPRLLGTAKLGQQSHRAHRTGREKPQGAAPATQ